MSRQLKKKKPNRVTFAQYFDHESWSPNLTGLHQSEREACQLILEFLAQQYVSEFDKLKFLKAVEILTGAVHAQAHGNMNDYFPKAVLARRIETLILEESTEILVSSVRVKAMLCIVALSQVHPPFYLCQKVNLASAAITSIFPLPLTLPSLDQKEKVSLYIQTTQALDEMLQALLMDNMDPDMITLQNFLEVLLPWLTESEKEHEQTRALGTVARLLRFICNFPELKALPLNCCFWIGGVKQKTETILKDLQKHFRGEWFANLQDLTMFFKRYLTPIERADVIMVSLETMTSANTHDIWGASKMLKMLMKHSVPEIGKVQDIIQFIYYNMNGITEPAAQSTIQKFFYSLAHTYTDEVILTLFRMEDESQRGVRKPWEILASFPKGYEVIMEHLLQRLTPHQEPRDQEMCPRVLLSPLIATRAIHELLLEPSRRMEVQSLFPSLFTALLFRVSFLVVEEDTEALQEQQQDAEWMDPVSCTVEALKMLMRSTGYGDHVSYVQKVGGWELLTSPERHYEGVTQLARALVIRNCWHNRPIFSVLINILQRQDYTNHFTALVFLTELLQCPHVAAIVDDTTVRILGNWFKCKEPATVKLLLQIVQIFAKHGNMARQLSLLQPYVLNCCYTLGSNLVLETLLALRCLVEHLTWQHSSSFLTQISFILTPFFEEDSETVRLTAFEIYGTLLNKIKRSVLVFPLRHQVLNLIVVLVLHLVDVNADVAQICRPTLCHTATILGWSKLKTIFAEKDVWTILRALLEQETSRASWFLKQSVTLFKSPQPTIRQAAVWFAGQIIQTLSKEDVSDIEAEYSALRDMQTDPDPTISCLATQTLYILEAREKMPAQTSTSCFCGRRSRKSRF
ncbi:maestro heat-like repeat-containing protein family member 7 [Talpa occidentalis]|uniref:maestro heat-like repeat-containing protein family member 7 n=1 Tax=Talpa occidentalis TaxID=50954 RepID=UPI0018907115|nr:maestro heat-like repeat-containing protein family member 7 [Talpa occidentalis]